MSRQFLIDDTQVTNKYENPLHLRKASKNYIELPFHTSQNGSHQENNNK